jgi:hypothetical protein
MKQEIEIIFSRNDNWGPTNIYTKAYDKFVDLYKDHPDITIHYVDSHQLRLEAEQLNQIDNSGLPIYNPCLMMIRNRYTGKYYLVSNCDEIKNLFICPSRTVNVNFLRGLITSIGMVFSDIEFEPISFINYIPFGYVPLNKEVERLIEENQNVEKILPDKLRFRNFPNDPFRQFITKDSRFDGIDKREGFLTSEEYIRELAGHKVNLSINGHAEVCHRDMEIMGLGTVLLRTRFVCKFHEPLIPNFHYVAIDVDNFRDYETIAQKLIAKYEEIKHKKDFLDFVGKNAREWYLRNGCAEGCANLLTKIVDFKKLI